MELKDEYSPNKIVKSSLCIGDSVTKAPEHSLHLRPQDFSFIIGGHQGSLSVDQKPSDQMPHKDIGSVVISNHEYPSSFNPHLVDRNKPFTIHIPLLTPRSIYISNGYDKTNVTIDLGEAAILAGDVTHGGVTLSQFTGWNPGLHLYFMSIFHQANLDDFEIDILAVARLFPHFLHRLNSDAQHHALSVIDDSQYTVYKAALASENSTHVVQSLENQIERLTLLLPKEHKSQKVKAKKDTSNVDSEDKSKKVKAKKEKINVDSSSPITVPKAAPGSLVTLHKNYPQATAMIEKKYGPTQVMPGDGSCGYWAVISFLVSEHKVKSDITIKQIRKEIHDYADKHKERFAGMEVNGSDAIFKLSDGDPGFKSGQRARRTPVATRLRGFVNCIMLNIYNSKKNYKTCTYAHYMDGSKVLPIVMHCYKPSNKLVVYESIQHNNDGFIYSTDIYTYNKELDTVFLERRNDCIAHVPGPKKCLLFQRSRHHYDILNNIKNE